MGKCSQKLLAYGTADQVDEHVEGQQPALLPIASQRKGLTQMAQPQLKAKS